MFWASQLFLRTVFRAIVCDLHPDLLNSSLKGAFPANSHPGLIHTNTSCLESIPGKSRPKWSRGQKLFWAMSLGAASCACIQILYFPTSLIIIHLKKKFLNPQNTPGSLYLACPRICSALPGQNGMAAV